MRRFRLFLFQCSLYSDVHRTVYPVTVPVGPLIVFPLIHTLSAVYLLFPSFYVYPACPYPVSILVCFLILISYLLSAYLSVFLFPAPISCQCAWLFPYSQVLYPVSLSVCFLIPSSYILSVCLSVPFIPSSYLLYCLYACLFPYSQLIYPVSMPVCSLIPSSYI